MNVPDQFEHLINSGQIFWHKAELSELSEWARSLVINYLDAHEIEWWLGSPSVGDSVVIRINDPILQYLDVLEETQQYMFCTDNHHGSIPPDWVSKYLLLNYVGVDPDSIPGLQLLTDMAIDGMALEKN